MVGIPDNTKYWAHPLRKNFSPAERIDLTETVLFTSAKRIKSGTFKGSFRLSDLITKFRITANAIDSTGVIGYRRELFQVNKALYINFDVPGTMTVSDKINIDLHVGNLNAFPLSVKITTDSGLATSPIGFTVPAGTFTVKAKSSLTKTITLAALNITSLPTFVKIGITSVYNGVTYADSLSVQVKVLPKGFPRQVSQGGSIGS
jgi:uncharacterized protein YfaS (alpha-2-macroglobulin family)